MLICTHDPNLDSNSHDAKNVTKIVVKNTARCKRTPGRLFVVSNHDESSTELIHELLMELLDPAHPLSARRKESRPEMESALLLSEAAAGNDANTGSLEETHAVEVVCVLALLLRGIDGLLRQCDGREQVHGAGGRGAADALHLLESVVEGVGARVEAGVDVVVFLLVELVGGGAFLGRVDHDFDHALADDGRAEHDADELVDLLDDL